MAKKIEEGKKYQAEPPLRRSCGTMAVHMMLLEQFPAFRARQFKLEQDTAKRRAAPFSLDKVKIVTVDVVVNVVYQTAEQNISDAQIKSQIAALNRDFSARNPDRSKVPAPWQGLVTECQNPVPARKDDADQDGGSIVLPEQRREAADRRAASPHCSRRSFSISGSVRWAAGCSAMRSSRVDRRRPTASSSTTRRSAPAVPRSRHSISDGPRRTKWGITSTCATSGVIPRTAADRTWSPTRRIVPGPNFQKPTFPVVTCNNGPNGDMFVNYMDYVDDDTMYMFTAQQVTRMRAAIEGPRSGLI